MYQLQDLSTKDWLFITILIEFQQLVQIYQRFPGKQETEVFWETIFRSFSCFLQPPKVLPECILES